MNIKSYKLEFKNLLILIYGFEVLDIVKIYLEGEKIIPVVSGG